MHPVPGKRLPIVHLMQFFECLLSVHSMDKSLEILSLTFTTMISGGCFYSQFIGEEWKM